MVEAYKNGDQKAYTAADFRVDSIPAADRAEPVDFGGVTEDGEKFSSDDIRGEVAVVNFWYAGCAPCRVEASDLEAVWQEHSDADVQFIGINTRDQADTAVAFADEFGITYPSLIDVDTAQAKLAFAKVVPISATPTTLVLDKQGRVAAKIIGPIDGTSVLSTLVKDALAEDS